MKESEAKKMVALWNKKNPVGTTVVVALDSGREIYSKTREEASVVSGMPVVWIDGIRGCYALARVKALDPEEVLARQAAGEAVPS